MLTYEDALELISKTIRPVAQMNHSLAAARGTVLARDIKARLDMPRFDNSAVDGYGVRQADIAVASKQQPVTLKLNGVSRAGGTNVLRLEPGQTVRIFTGAAVPAGVEAVVMQEHCTAMSDGIRFTQPVKAGENIRRQGEEYHRGHTLLAKGTRITPPVTAVLASQGYAKVSVHPLPRVAVVTSGDELATPGSRLAQGRIFDSTTPSLLSALGQLGIRTTAVNVPDKLALAKRKLARLLPGNDFILIAGGISVGDFDVIRQALTEIDVREVYWRLAIKPGKPNYFGVAEVAVEGGKRRRPVYIFGLPGNPVSALVSHLKLVRPGLSRFMGEAWQPLSLRASLTAPLRKNAGRLEWVRAVLTKDVKGTQVTPLPAQGSNMLSGLATANCLVDFPLELGELKAGSEVIVEPITWGA